MKKKLYLIDAMAFAFRAFHAINARLTDANNRPTNAIYGFTRILLKLLREHTPDYIVVVFDAPGKNFRDEMYPEYKATRSKTPPELIEQIPRMYEVVQALNLPMLVVPGVEADDVIGTLSVKGEEVGMEVVLVSGDKDFMQLVSEHTRMYDPGKDEKKAWSGLEDVRTRFGVEPKYVCDALALIGDTADNIPGVRQIGEVKSRRLLSQYNSLENLYEHIEEISGKQREYLEQDKEQAFFSRKLTTIKLDVPLDIGLEQCIRKQWEASQLKPCLEALGFHKLLEELLPEELPVELPHEYRLVNSIATLKQVIAEMQDAGLIAVDTETTNIHPMFARLVGISLCSKPGYAWYVPVSHAPRDLEDIMNASGEMYTSLSCEEVLETIRPLLEDPSIHKVGHNIKYDIIVLNRAGISLRGVVMDSMVASYLTDPSRLRHNLDELSLHYFNFKKIPISELIGTGSKSITFDQVSVDKATEYACEDADMTYRLAEVFMPSLAKDRLDSLFNTIELPLIRILANMEMRGITIDGRQFSSLQVEISENLKKLESTIYQLAGESFNINSPKQLQGILFEKIGLKPLRKTKSGYSTDVAVLEALAQEHPLPEAILEYRTLEKLRGTYVEALPKLVHPVTKRIHTSFNQAVAATGRLSSSNPNLQNIPVRTGYGRRIRQGFVAGESSLRLIAADYSQIELRILAHLSKDEKMLEAFNADEDIHRDTAAKVFGVAPAEVSPEMRRQAKAVNFGVVYGISDFGLARNLGIARSEAKIFIDSYFETYSGVRSWIERVKEETRQHGFVTTMFGRRRYIAEINSTNGVKRNAAERVAVNTPVQGAAADIIKIAMVRLDDRLKEFDGTYSLLQVHDELVVETPENLVEPVVAAMKDAMENVTQLDVPLKVDVGIGENWAEIH
ncbi:MAG: DNA polymerase I [Candidatus Hydrogenedentes bacterium]|nr:DNA polymerase I [Candidatus Hydrogenedentota bacterium]